MSFNMGVLQGTASGLGYDEFIIWAAEQSEKHNLNEDEKRRLWDHWKSNKRAETLRREQYEKQNNK